ncbi:hypothetical protein NW768_007429 [Fusarium equiseti]|uniref:Uncharacterized protein n=1 Tax=Fusarium equiseti TaxID=61235 RepID=A0ABQ8R7Q8_FUSEQ|nr:hypothetical protein NW768_007429 [Fusarium equiseti]
MPTATKFLGYQFTNLGPLTTTHSPPPSCTTGTTDGIEFAKASTPTYVFGWESCSVTTMGKCHPSGSQHDKIRSEALKTGGMAVFDYFSPGLVCPQGWTTAGKLGHGDGSTITREGIFTTDEATPSYPFRMDEVWLNVLASDETLAVCCPSGWTAGIAGICQSSIMPLTSATYTEFCRRQLPASLIATVYTVGTSVYSDPIKSIRTWDNPDDYVMTVPFTTGRSLVPVDPDEVVVQKKLHAVHMVYKEGDSEEASKTGSVTGSASSGTDDGESAASGGTRAGPVVAVVVGILVGAGLLFH